MKCTQCKADIYRKGDNLCDLMTGKIHLCMALPAKRSAPKPRLAVSCWSADIVKWKPPVKEPFPPEADGNWQHPYWKFLDKGEKVLAEALP